jgi:spore cortex formation protein SpoVR/YcgB (stage V sporulation)
MRPLFDGAEWSFELIRKVYDQMGEIALGEMGLDIYPNQIEVITAEQMLDSYSSIGMPLMYRHWSFGKRFAHDEAYYKRGMRSLAYELVINSDPCINYIMEENSMTMQALVLAHAAYGHNHFFKNNYQFQLWTQPDHIIDYLAFAKRYVAECEERFGQDTVESVLDAAHALMNQGVSRDLRPRPRNVVKHERERAARRREHEEATYDDIYRTLPEITRDNGATEENEGEQRRIGLPEENLLYFLEKNAPKLEDWQRELLRIVRLLSQYFYPQRQTKMMNEGCATFVHYEILNRLYERGQLTDGTMLEFLHSHSSVIFQPTFNDRRFSGLNPYALGFAMMNDIRRIASEPTAEDREWFPEFAGCGDWMGTLRQAWAEFRDESFVLQYLSPKLMRDFRRFSVVDDA